MEIKKFLAPKLKKKKNKHIANNRVAIAALRVAIAALEVAILTLEADTHTTA